MDPKSTMTVVLIRRGKFGHRDKQERKPRKDRDWSDTATGQETRRGEEGFSPRAFGESLALLTP